MKRIIKVLIVLLMCIPFVVKADMGMPEKSEYKVIVTNPQGTKNLNSDSGEVFPYDKVLTVNYEQVDDGVLYLFNFGQDSIKIKASDVKIYGDEVVVGEPLKNGVTGTTYYAYEGGEFLYKGPSYVYGKVSDEPIPKGAKLKVVGGYDDVFSYVEYNGKRGWIFTYPYMEIKIYDHPTKFASILKEDSSIIMISDSIKAYAKPYDSENEFTNVPVTVGQEYKVDLLLKAGPKEALFGTINGDSIRWISGWNKINDNDWKTTYFEKSDMFFYPKNSVDYYSDFECTKKVGTLDAMKKIDIYAVDWYIDYEGGFNMYKSMINLDGKYYFLNENNEGFESTKCAYVVVLGDREVPYYEDYKLTKPAGYLEAGKIIKIAAEDTSNVYMVELDGKQYYIDGNYTKFENTDSFITTSYSNSVSTYSSDLILYKNFKSLKELSDEVTIPAGEEYNEIKSITKNGIKYMLVKYKDNIGIIKNYNSKKATFVREEYVCPFSGENLNSENTEEVVDPNDNNKDVSENKVMDTKTIIIICVVVGVALAITTIVIIVLVNKSKKANIVPEPTPIEQPVQSVEQSVQTFEPAPIAPQVQQVEENQPTNNDGENN